MQEDPPTELSRLGGLARIRSAPTTWLDALLSDDHHTSSTFTHLLSSDDNPNPAPAPAPAHPPRPESYPKPEAHDPVFDDGFQRMNSSPADFLGANIEGYFAGFGAPATTSYDDGSPVRKRFRESDVDQLSPSFVGQRRGELKTANSLVEMEMEKLLEDSVACRVRAKRGCATHPRSIAERVRRTRISDRIRKLQELVPNMDKQTNTADMLEEAVEYVKTLQRQIQDLTEQQKKCKCMAMSLHSNDK